jgi:hypothetical protein
MFKEPQPYNRNSSSEPYGLTVPPMRRITWGAVFAGVVVALVVQMLFSLLGLGVGMGTVNPMEESNPFSGLGTGAMIWWIATMLISLFIGGMVAGRLAGMPKAADSSLHGILMWSVFTLVSVFLLSTAIGGIVSGVGSAMGKALSMGGQGMSSVAPKLQDQLKQKAEESGINIDEMKQQAEQMGKDPQSRKQMADMAEKLYKNDGKMSEPDRQKAIDMVAKTGKSREEATAQVDKMISSVQQGKAKLDQTKAEAEQKARKTGEDVAGAMAKAGIFGFIGMVLGGIVSALGGMVGRPIVVVVPVATEAPVYK